MFLFGPGESVGRGLDLDFDDGFWVEITHTQCIN